MKQVFYSNSNELCNVRRAPGHDSGRDASKRPFGRRAGAVPQISRRLKDSLLGAVMEWGARRALIDLSGSYPVLRGLDQAGRPFSVDIDGPSHAAWHEAINRLTFDASVEATVGLLRFLGATRSAPLQPTADVVRFGAGLDNTERSDNAGLATAPKVVPNSRRLPGQSVERLQIWRVA